MFFRRLLKLTGQNNAFRDFGIPLRLTTQCAETKDRLLHFKEFAKDANPEILVTLIQSLVERIYIANENDERHCHIFIKGCSGEDYDIFFRETGYIKEKGGKSALIPIETKMCDSEHHSKNYMVLKPVL